MEAILSRYALMMKDVMLLDSSRENSPARASADQSSCITTNKNKQNTKIGSQGKCIGWPPRNVVLQFVVVFSVLDTLLD